MRGEICLNKSNFAVMMKTEKEEQQKALDLCGEHKRRKDASCPPYQAHVAQLMAELNNEWSQGGEIKS